MILHIYVAIKFQPTPQKKKFNVLYQDVQNTLKRGNNEGTIRYRIYIFFALFMCNALCFVLGFFLATLCHSSYIEKKNGFLVPRVQNSRQITGIQVRFSICSCSLTSSICGTAEAQAHVFPFFFGCAFLKGYTSAPNCSILTKQ